MQASSKNAAPTPSDAEAPHDETPHDELSGTGESVLDSLLTADVIAGTNRSQSQALTEPRLRTARLVGLQGSQAEVLFRRSHTSVPCEIAPEVDREFLRSVLEQGGSVLVEDDAELPLVVGVIATRYPASLTLKAGTVTLEADRELLLRSGRGAIRIREDGDIEVVGTRISATSRGLFRLVGKLLRLN